MVNAFIYKWKETDTCLAPRTEGSDANRDEQEPAGRRPAGRGRSSSRPDGWSEGLTVESPCGSETRWRNRSGSVGRWWDATTLKPSGRGTDGCRNQETGGLVRLPPFWEGFEAPGLRRLPWWTVGSTPAGRAGARTEEDDGRNNKNIYQKSGLQGEVCPNSLCPSSQSSLWH